jgi:shikimate kinase
MGVKLFILGLPGSGKSTISHHIADYVGERQRSTTHIYDYEILLQMYQEDTKGQFRPAGHGGFDAIDMTVLDTALRKLEQDNKALISITQLQKIILIEFSRNVYEESFQQFSQEFLDDSYFLYLNVEREMCKKRLRERTAAPNTSNDHHVSEYIFDTYYTGDDGIDLPRILKRNYSIDNLKVRVINNNVSQEDCSYLIKQFEEIQRFIDYIIENETPRLQETEPMKICENEEVKSELERN